VTSASTNPQFTLPQLGAHFIYGETAAYQFVFGEWDLESEDPEKMILTPKNLIQYFFGKDVSAPHLCSFFVSSNTDHDD
jgi:hypothetical protein